METRWFIILFSALITLGIIIAFVFFTGGLSFLYPGSKGAPVFPTPTITSQKLSSVEPSRMTPGISTPQLIVSTFYLTYIDCKSVPQNTCPPTTSVNFDTEKVQASLQRNASQGDPITCSPTVPVNVTVPNVSPITEGQATTQVVEDLGNGATRQLAVTVELQSGTWRIINIACP